MPLNIWATVFRIFQLLPVLLHDTAFRSCSITDCTAGSLLFLTTL